MCKSLTVKVMKYPNIPHYQWESNVIMQTDEYVILHSKKGRKLQHFTKKKVFTLDYDTIEIFFFDKWFTVAIDIFIDGETEYYCNISKPCKFIDCALTFVDLDIDVVKKRNESWQVIDLDEFRCNSEFFKYPNDLKERALSEQVLLMERIKKRKFPFNGFLIPFVENVFNKETSYE